MKTNSLKKTVLLLCAAWLGAGAIQAASPGSVVAWGDNSYGQTTVPVAAQSGVTAIAAGDEHTVALKNDGSVVAWGYNGNDEGGVGGQTNVPVAAQSGVTAIAAGRYHTVALKNDGNVLAWGRNFVGETTVPVAAQSGVTAIAAGEFHTVALKNDGSVVAWGNETNVPMAAQSGVTAIAAGGGHTIVALKNDGSVVAWGDNCCGQTNVPVAAQSGVTAIAAGAGHIVALKSDGSVVAWGWNGDGQTTVPVAAQSGVMAIAAGYAHTVALKNDGSVLAWGDNLYGQTTVPAAAQSGVTAIAAGFGHTVALVHNAPPVLPVMADRTVNELTLLTVTNPATDADPLDSLTYSLIDPPAGATIDAAGTITWTPTEAQGPGVFTITTQVSDNGTPPLSTTNSFTVTVNEVNVAPALGNLSDRIVNPGQTIGFNATATDADLPANALAFSLINPPQGASIDPDSGAFLWRPAIALASTASIIQVRVQDTGSPALSNTKSFTVNVNPLAPVELLQPITANGQFRFQVHGTTGPDYVIETSADLVSWTVLTTIPSASTPFEVVDHDMGSRPIRFFRVKLQP